MSLSRPPFFVPRRVAPQEPFAAVSLDLSGLAGPQLPTLPHRANADLPCSHSLICSLDLYDAPSLSILNTRA